MPHWDWMTAAGPPGCRVSALAPDETIEVSPIVLLSLEQDVTFYRPCKTLVSTRDRQSAQFVFDLWSYADVSKHAEGILNRLRDGFDAMRWHLAGGSNQSLCQMDCRWKT